MVKKYIVRKKYICLITDSLCGDDNQKYNEKPPICDDCDVYLKRNDPIVEDKTYTHVVITAGNRSIIGVK